eukprot:scaffold12205_cov97-Isochrysis_galbana.AAC.2
MRGRLPSGTGSAQGTAQHRRCRQQQQHRGAAPPLPPATVASGGAARGNLDMFLLVNDLSRRSQDLSTRRY